MKKYLLALLIAAPTFASDNNNNINSFKDGSALVAILFNSETRIQTTVIKEGGRYFYSALIMNNSYTPIVIKPNDYTVGLLKKEIKDKFESTNINHNKVK